MSKTPDTVILNGRLITFDPDRPFAEALAIAGGLIAAVGTTAEVRALAVPSTRVIDAGGAPSCRASSTVTCTCLVARSSWLAWI